MRTSTRRSTRYHRSALLGAASAMVLCAATVSASSAAGVRVGLSETQLVLASAQVDTAVAAVVRNDSDTPAKGDLSWAADTVGPAGLAVTPSSQEYEVPPHSMRYYTFKVQGVLPPGGADPVLHSGDLQAGFSIREGLSLAGDGWRWKVSDTVPPCLAAGWQKPGFDDSAWAPIALPSDAQDGRYQWYRRTFTIPAALSGSPLSLEIGSVDEADVTYVNGTVVGKGSGWDKRRLYKVPSDIVNWSGPNTVVIMADNSSFGGGVYRAPLRLVSGAPMKPQPSMPKAQYAPRPAPSPVGAPLPFRPMTAVDGVLRYSDGGEVGLFGVNYLPQSWYHFTLLEEGGFDPKTVIDQDFDHMAKMGVQVIRIHVFDTEISDSQGNLVENEHLDLLDYIVKKAQEKGIYMFLTPIAWWGSPSQLPDSFSVVYPKEAMVVLPEAIAAEVNYTKQFLNHRNAYTGRAYKDEPNVCAFEIMNEPDPKYLEYRALVGAVDPSSSVQAMQRLWQAWLAKTGLPDTPGSYYLYTYEAVRDWVDTLHDAIRSTGARQPVAAPTFWFDSQAVASVFGDSPGNEAVMMALADSKCEAVTLGAYPGGLTTANDRHNLLPQAVNASLVPALNRKARLTYEFDAAGTVSDDYLYLAMARMWRSMGVQIAAQFQYDSAVLADYNRAWTVHYLNWLYTPGKSVAILEAEQAFARIPRETPFSPRTDTRQDDQVFGDFAVSFKRNLAVLSAPDTLMYSGSFGTDWPPLKLPEAPKSIVGRGTSPYVSYDGSGLYRLEGLGGSSVALELTPDVAYLRGPLDVDDGPLAELTEREHTLSLTLPGGPRYTLMRRDGTKLEATGQAGTTFKVRPGEYVLGALESVNGK